MGRLAKNGLKKYWIEKRNKYGTAKLKDNNKNVKRKTSLPDTIKITKKL